MVDGDPRSIDPQEVSHEKDSLSHLIRVRGSDHIFHAVSQTVGWASLRNYFLGEISFRQVPPFLIDNIVGTRPSRYDSFIGKGGSNVRIFMNLDRKIAEPFETGHFLVAIPGEDEHRYYQWLNFFEVDEQKTIDFNEVGSCRVNREEFKFEISGWHDFARQIFLDYLSGKEVDIAHLRPFKIFTNSLKTIWLGYINKKSVGDIQHNDFQPNQPIVCVPKYDPERGYSWLDTYSEEDNQRIIASRRFYKGETKVSDWKGPEIQSLIDWIAGILPLNKTMLVRIPVPGGGKYSLEESYQNVICVDLRNNPGDELALQADADGLYEWINIYKTVSTPEDSTLQFMQSVRVHRDRKIKLGTWVRPDKQRYLDFLDGKLNANQLKPLFLKVGAENQFQLLSYQGKGHRLSLGDKGKFPVGTEVKVTPFADESGNLILEIGDKSESQIYKRYIFSRNDNDFRTIPEDITSYSEVLTFPKLDKTGTYTDTQGCWAPQTYLVEAYKMNPRTFKKLAGMRSRYGAGANGKSIILYNEADFKIALEDKRNPQTSSENTSISPEEADADLDKFLSLD